LKIQKITVILLQWYRYVINVSVVYGTAAEPMIGYKIKIIQTEFLSSGDFTFSAVVSLQIGTI